MSTSAQKKILIVEDEFIIYQELVEFFEEKGFYIIRHPEEKAVDNYDDAIELLKTNKPDIAIVDIKIKGEKDGLELCAYIKKYFKTLIVILSAYDNYVNLERATAIAVDDFVLKVDKPVNKRQLWAKIHLALPKFSLMQEPQSTGRFLGVREIEININTSANNKKRDNDPVYLETFIKWENITHIESYNKGVSDGNNNILIHTINGKKGYLYRSTLSEMTHFLPEYFVRVDKSNIINLYHITAKGKGSNYYYIGASSFKLSDTYKTFAEDKINLILSDKFKG